MEREKVKALFAQALAYAEENKSKELKWCRGIIVTDTFRDMPVKAFLEEYCWVLYAAGFKVSTVENKFEQLRAAFCNFDLDKICNMKSVEEVLKIINNKLKANCFVRGVKLIQEEGYENFKSRILKEGMIGLQVLPYIKEITQKHLARNIGLADIYKDDLHLVRLAEFYKARDVEELASFLAKETGEKQGVVDLVLWRYCADEQWTGSKNMKRAEQSP